MIVIWGLRKPCNSVLVNDPIHFNKGGTKHELISDISIAKQCLGRTQIIMYIAWLWKTHEQTAKKQKTNPNSTSRPYLYFFGGGTCLRNDWKSFAFTFGQQLHRCHVQETQRLARQRRLELRNLAVKNWRKVDPKKRNVLLGCFMFQPLSFQETCEFPEKVG